jgi:APA family basic amino acid/polyamine antiporter
MAVSGLKRALGLPEVSFIAIGFTIGGGVFVFTGIVLRIAGPALPLAYALAVIPVFISMLPLAMLGAAIPATGGNYKYPSRMVSPGLAFVGVWTYALATFFGQIPLYSLACARYAAVFMPGLPLELVAAGIITVFALINLLGVRLAAQFQALMVLILIAALLYFSAGGLARFDAANFAEFSVSGVKGVLLGTALLTFTYFGSNSVIELGGEIKNPGRVIPRAFMIAFPVVMILYLLLSIALVGAAPWREAAAADEPLLGAGKSFLSHAGFLFFVSGGAILALMTTLNAIFIVGTKSLLAMISDNLLPRSLGRINSRFGTAHLLFLIIWALSLAGVFSGLPLETFASYAALGGLMIFFPVLLASTRLPRRYPELYRQSGFRLKGVFLWFCPAVGFAMILFFGAAILADLKSPLKIAFFVVFMLSGGLYYRLRKRFLLARGENLADLLKLEDWT